MKKAQILSALALAFALGVAVIPTASTYAASFVQDGKVVDGLNEKIENAIANAMDKCGYHLVNTAKKYYYNEYVTLIGNLDAAETAITNAEKAELGVPADANATPAVEATGLYKAYDDAITTLVNGADDTANTADDNTLPSSVEKTIPSSKKSYKAVTDYIKAAIVALNNKALTVVDQDADKATEKAFRTAADTLQTALDDAADAIDAAKVAPALDIQHAIEAINNKAFDNTLTYAEAVSAANALSSNDGFTTVAKVRNLKVAIDAAQELVDTKATMPASDADKAINAINKALNGGTVTGSDLPNNPSDGDGNPNLTSPDTGALNAEGNATTTVAMVAGVATALTAAGAGVVAYRNARRSTRK